MKFELDDHHRNVPDEELIQDLRRVAAQMGKASVTIDEYNELGKYHSTTLSRRFGNWFSALDRAGLERTRVLGITDEELFQNLEGVWISLGRQPRYQEVQKPLSKYSVGTYEKRFGGWRKALEAFVGFVNADQREAGGTGLETHAAPRGAGQSGRRSPNHRLRFIVMRRDSFSCKACGASPAKQPGVELQVDHIVSWAKGGVTVEENLQTLCSKCNVGKNDLSWSDP